MTHRIPAAADTLDRRGLDRLAAAGFEPADLADAIEVLRIMRGERPLSVRTAADAFNCGVEAIRAAVPRTRALYLAGPSDNPGTQFIEIAAPPSDDLTRQTFLGDPDTIEP